MTFAPVRAARLAWERQQPQQIIEIGDLVKTEEPVSPPPVVGLPCATANTGSSEHIGVGTIAQLVPGNSPIQEGTGPLVVVPSAREGRPTPTPNTNGDRCSTYPGSAAVASQETS